MVGLPNKAFSSASVKVKEECKLMHLPDDHGNRKHGGCGVIIVCPWETDFCFQYSLKYGFNESQKPAKTKKMAELETITTNYMVHAQSMADV